MQHNDHQQEIKKLQDEVRELFITMVRCWALDIDANIFAIEIEGEPPPNLSSSAEKKLSTSIEGVIQSPELLAGFYAKKARTHSREQWQSMFNALLEVNDRYEWLEPYAEQPLLSFMFLTHATYEKDYFIKNLFEKVFGRDVIRAVDPAYYNRYDQINKIGTFDKGKFMERMYEESNWKKIYGLYSTKQLCLFDDNIENIKSAESCHFMAVHNPTTPENRGNDQTFTKEENNVFDAMQHQIKVAHELCDKLEKIAKLKNPPNVAPSSIRFFERPDTKENEPSWGLARLDSFYDTDDEIENPREPSPVTSQSSTSRGSGLFSPSPTSQSPANENLIENLRMLKAIIDDYYPEIEDESVLENVQVNLSINYLYTVKDLLDDAFDNNGKTKFGIDFAEVVEEIATLAKRFKPLEVEDGPTSIILANKLSQAISTSDFPDNSSQLLEDIIHTRMITYKR